MDAYRDILNRITPAGLTGSVADTFGPSVAVADFPAPLGAIASIERAGSCPLEAEVVGFRHRKTILFPFAPTAGVRQGAKVTMLRTSPVLRVGEQLLGRILDAHGRAIDGRP